MPYPLDVFIIQLCIWLTDESDWLIRINCVPKIAFFHSLHDTSLSFPPILAGKKHRARRLVVQHIFKRMIRHKALHVQVG